MPFGSRPGPFGQGVLELVTLATSAYRSSLQRFCANFLRLSKHSSFVNASFAFFARLTFPSSRSVNSQRSTGDTSPEPIRLAGANSRVMQWLVLCGIPYRGPGALASPDPANQPSKSHIGRALRPLESSTASFATPQEYHGAVLLASGSLSGAPPSCDFLRISTTRVLGKRAALWKAPQTCGKRPARRIFPKIFSASHHSSSLSRAVRLAWTTRSVALLRRH